MTHAAEDLGPGPAPVDVLGRLDDATRLAGRPGPAAVIGDWLGHAAVIAPSIRLDAGVAPPDRPHGWWFGHVSFPDRVAEAALPAAVGGVTDGVLVHDDDRWAYRTITGTPCPDWIRACLTPNPAADPPRPWTASWTAPPREPHDEAIGACLAAIRAGEVYQACVCTRYRGDLRGAAIDVARTGIAALAPRKAAFLSGGWGSVVSFSPETFLRRTGEDVVSSPIKGTVPASTDPAALLTSVKDVAENIMIVDLVRNDLGRVAVAGSVTVPELLVTRPAPGVWHLVSSVAARVTSAVGTTQLLDATFPPGSVTGAPKVRARELLRRWETDARGVYCGAIGVVAPDGDLDLNVAIRTVEIAPDNSMQLGVGGGITIDSDPDREWQECLDKAASIVGLRHVGG
ncbi:aminodeoxychorismate synthase component I [Williamsia herbipolensis]|uniref:aminodeoxychorismate synthase component I n=1 Tax=Williamsia herbipolensis TaxID=1603258 RepID=UPI0009E2BEDA|nr:aminodeoxychorismate synthase component I [Williamsia herbipolensis]